MPSGTILPSLRTGRPPASTGLGATTSGALLGFEIDSHTVACATLICPTSIP